MAGRAEILAAFDDTMRRQVRDHGGQAVALDGVVLALGPTNDAYDNYVTWSCLDAASADAAIEAVIARFAERAFEWKLFAHDTPADLGERLVRRGFVADVPETMVALALEEMRPIEAAPEGIRIARIVDRAGIEDVARVWDAIEEGDAARALASELEETPATLSIYAAYDGDRPVASAWTRFHEGTPFATLWGGGTIVSHRGRGIYRALVARRVDEARVRGFRYATIDARETSRPILERVGFTALTGVTGYLWRPPGASPAAP